MKHTLLLLCLIIPGRHIVLAQTVSPEELLNTWSARSPIEKAYLHTDKEQYLAGETIWFKAYTSSGYMPDTISTTLFIELWNAQSRLVMKKTAPILYGFAKGQLELPDTLFTGNYFIRAYTPTMLNHGEDFLFRSSLFVYGKKSAATYSTDNSIRAEFFPESGNFVASVPNTVAVKLTQSGWPLDGKGIVRNEKGDSITSFSTYHDGMGMFDINPAPDQHYYVQLENESTKYTLPAVTETGAVLRLMANPGGRYFEIYQHVADPSQRAAFMIGQMQHQAVFSMDLDMKKDDINGFINTSKLNSGILQVTIFNSAGLPLAERLCFIDNKEYLQKGELLLDTISFSPRAKNSITLQVPGITAGSFSVSITDPDHTAGSRPGNIISNLLLTSDLKGFIHNPAYYFSSDDDSVKNAQDLLMMINGWRRFKWTELPALVKAPLAYHDAGYIPIAGKVNIRDTKKPLTSRELFMLISPSEDSLNTSMQMINTDSAGRYRVDSMIFYGKTRFLVTDVQVKKSKWLDLYPDADSIPTPLLPAPLYIKLMSPLMAKAATVNGMQSDYDAILKAEGKMLQGIVVKAKKKTPLQELDERYASGLFSGDAAKIIDLVNTNEKIYQTNIFDYIQGRVGGIRVERRGADINLYYQQRMTIRGGPVPMILYLDEMQVDGRMLSTIPAHQVAMIKVYNSFIGAEGNAPGGALAVYTKQHADITSALATGADIFQFKGYSVVKEFYAPDYDHPNPADASKADNRITLHWQPEIILDGEQDKARIRFYNNDRSKSYKIVVEGMTVDGKLLLIEKLVTPDKKAF